MRAIGFLVVMLILIGVAVVVGLLVLAFLGVRSALNEERKRRKKPEKDPEAIASTQRGGPVPLYRPKE